MNNFLNELLCGFSKAHSTQHALFKLLQAWQKELDIHRNYTHGSVKSISLFTSRSINC